MDIPQENTPGKTRRWARQFLFATMTFFMTISTVQASIDFCWKDSYGRGVGTIPSTCTAGLKKEGMLCYEPCKAGYETSTLGACLQKCTNGFTDQGLFCRKAEYHVKEYPWQFGDPLNDSGMTRRCEAVHGSGKCWKPLLVVVERCKVGYEHILGFCRPERAPNCIAEGYAGQFDLSCTKDTYFKTPKIANCANGQENNAGLCYKSCGSGSYGVGPVCWSSCSAKTLPTECGAGCTSDATACATQTTNLVMSVLDSAVSIATAVGTLGVATAIKQGTTVATKAALKQGGKASIKEMLKHAGKISTSTARGLVKEQLKGIVVKNGIEYTGLAASAVDNAMSLFSNISDISNGKYASQEERDFMVAQEVLNNVALLDPSGIVGIVAAYAKPKCSVLAQGDVPQSTSTSAGATDAYLAEYTAFTNLLKARVSIAEMKIVDVTEQRMNNSAQISQIVSPYKSINVKQQTSLKTQIKELYKVYGLAHKKAGNPSHSNPSAEMIYILSKRIPAELALEKARTDYKLLQYGTSPSIPKELSEQIKILNKVNFAELMKQAKQERSNAIGKLRNSRKLFDDLLKKRNTRAFWALSPGISYADGLDFNGAKDYCKSNDGQLANKQQLINANQHRDFSMCGKGWLADGSSGYVMKGTHAGCGRNGFNSGGFPNKTTKLGTYCVGLALPPSVGNNLIAHVLKFWALSPGNGYADGLNFNGAKAYCESNNGQLANKQQLIKANKHGGFSMCAKGWLADGSSGYVMKGTHAGCGRNGFNSGGFPNKTTKLSTYCVGPTVPASAGSDLIAPVLKFWALSPGNGYADGLNFNGAKAYCESNNGQLANKQQLIKANKHGGFSMCAKGWLADGSSGYVMKGTHAGCGRNGFNSGGSPNKTTKLGTYCVGPTVPASAGKDLISKAL